MLKLKLGWQSNLQMYSIVILFQGEGLCAFYKDSVDQVQRFRELNGLSPESFTHRIFDDYSHDEHFFEENDFLGDSTETFGIWNTIYRRPESIPSMAISIMYELKDL